MDIILTALLIVFCFFGFPIIVYGADYFVRKWEAWIQRRKEARNGKNVG